MNALLLRSVRIPVTDNLYAVTFVHFIVCLLKNILIAVCEPSNMFSWSSLSWEVHCCLRGQETCSLCNWKLHYHDCKIAPEPHESNPHFQILFLKNPF